MSIETYEQLVLSLVPSVYYPFSESGQVTALDFSSNENNGVYEGGYTQSQGGLIDSGTSVLLDGVSGSHIRVPSSPAINVSSAFTIAAWVESEVEDVRQDVYGRYSGGDNKRSIIFSIGADNKLFILVNDDGLNGSNALVKAEDAHDFTTVSFVCAVFDQGSLNLYINGVLIPSTATAQIPNSVLQTNVDAFVGSTEGNDAFRGKVDEFSLHSSALSENDISDLYLMGLEGSAVVESRVSGHIYGAGSPVSRIVRAFSYDDEPHQSDAGQEMRSKSLGHATSDPTTGEYTINLLDAYSKEVFVVVFDEYGLEFAPELSLSVGDRIHPTIPNGHVYECDGAGTLPATEPVWGTDTETSQLHGTVSLIARPFYRPVVHGPVVPEVTNA